jgi:cobalt-precorrin 5A hydrolase/precorrin-3B C17-methyltransferase
VRIVALSVTEPGRALARRLPFEHVHGHAGTTLAERWDEVDAFVAVLAVGATVRLIAPLLTDKARDPAVVCLDDSGGYAVVVCGGHQGGGNALARRLAGLVGCEAVVTTATDRLGVVALDQIPSMTATGDVAGATAAMLAGATLRIESPQGWPVPGVLTPLAAPPGDTDGSERSGREPEQIGRASAGTPSHRVVITDRRTDGGGDVLLRPRSLVVGVGTSTGATPAELIGAVDHVLDMAGLAPESVGEVATIDRRAGHPAVTALVAHLDARLRAVHPDVLDRVAVPHPSDVVRRAVGSGSVAEAAALIGAGPDADLVVAKTAGPTTTVAVARRRRPAGAVSVVGLGPGGPGHRTPAAEQAVRHADLVVGYTAYVDQCRDLLGPGQRVADFPLGAELARARVALAEASVGNRVALVCSGDAEVYAMASPLLELAGLPDPDGTLPFAGVDVAIVPGVTASLAAGAALGAPLGHDHAVISLSDLHTPWDRIAARLEAAALGDFVVVLYNPRSLRRTWQLGRARDILLAHRPASTPVGVVTDVARPGERVLVTTLASLPCEDVQMTTCVIVGSSTTRILNGRMVTPRGYPT